MRYFVFPLSISSIAVVSSLRGEKMRRRSASQLSGMIRSVR